MPKQPKKQRGIFERPAGSGFWWVCYFDQYGRRHREKVGIKSRALEIYQQRKTEIRFGRFEPEDIKSKHQNVLFSELIEDRKPAAKMLQSGRNEFKRLSHWEKAFGDRPAKSITAKDVEAAKLDLLEGNRVDHPKPLSPASVNRYLATLKTLFNLGVNNGKVEKNPVVVVKNFKEDNNRIRWLTDEEEARLFAELPGRYHPLVLVALHTGMRKTEELSLEWSDVDFKLGQITVRKSKSGKGRVIPLNNEVAEVLRLVPRHINNPYVFNGKKDRARMTDLPREWERYLEQAKIKDFHWHDLRHTFASRLVMAGVDLYTVSRLLGHSDIKMSMRYAHLAPDYLKSAVQFLTRSATRSATKQK